MKERIQKVLGNAGVASRRQIEEMVRQGRIAVNGRIPTTLPVLVDVQTDRVTVDGEIVQAPVKRGGSDNRGGGRLYILLNKPKGVLCTNATQGEQLRAIDLLPPGLGVRVYPVGRLDAQSKGLVLLTNDGELTNQLTHPRYGAPKTYRIVVDGLVSPQTVESIAQGVWLTDEKTGKGFKTTRCQVKVVKRARDKCVLDLTLCEGRNAALRRMLAKVGHKVRDLTRTRIGPLTLEGLNPGHSRVLAGSEIKRLKEWTQRRQTISPSEPPSAERSI